MWGGGGVVVVVVVVVDDDDYDDDDGDFCLFVCFVLSLFCLLFRYYYFLK